MSVKEHLSTAKITLYQRVFTRCSLNNLLLILVLLAYLGSNSEGSCSSKVFRRVASEGARLENNVMKESETDNEIECAHLCLFDYPLCKSINYEMKNAMSPSSRHKCQLNNATKSLQPQNFANDEAFKYIDIMEENVDETNPVEENSTPVQKSCSDLYKKGERKDGVYNIEPDGLGAFNVRCDMTTSGGGWTVFQRRMDGSVDFYLGWNEYKKGFGNLTGEFWLGLDKIHRLSKSGENVLRVDLEDFENETRHANYSTFVVANETTTYKLNVRGYSGDCGDSLAWHNGRRFSTKDADNDDNLSRNCAAVYKGAWWYSSCVDANLNGQYLRGSHPNSHGDGVNWAHWRGYKYSLKKTEMKIRPRSF